MIHSLYAQEIKSQNLKTWIQRCISTNVTPKYIENKPIGKALDSEHPKSLINSIPQSSTKNQMNLYNIKRF